MVSLQLGRMIGFAPFQGFIRGMSEQEQRMSRFRVTAHMKAPLVLGGGYFTLDGLLGALLFDRLDCQFASNRDPLFASNRAPSRTA